MKIQEQKLKFTVLKLIYNLTSAEFGLDTDPKRSIVNTEKSQFFDGDVNTAVRANGVKLENTNNLDVAEYTIDGMMADSNGKHVRFGTQIPLQRAEIESLKSMVQQLLEKTLISENLFQIT